MYDFVRFILQAITGIVIGSVIIFGLLAFFLYRQRRLKFAATGISMGNGYQNLTSIAPTVYLGFNNDNVHNLIPGHEGQQSKNQNLII